MNMHGHEVYVVLCGRFSLPRALVLNELLQTSFAWFSALPLQVVTLLAAPPLNGYGGNASSSLPL